MSDKKPATSKAKSDAVSDDSETEATSTKTTATDTSGTDTSGTDASGADKSGADNRTNDAVAEPSAAASSTPVSPDVEAAGEKPARAKSARAKSAPAAPAEAKPVKAKPAEPVQAPAAETAEPAPSGQPRVVYVDAPAAPKKKGNRGVGLLFVLLSAILFAALFATAFLVVGRSNFFSSATFYVPLIAFVIGFALLVLLLNRANWWGYIAGSLFVAAFVYFGTISGVLLLDNVVLLTAEQASARFSAGLVNPFVILAALLAREVSMWTGAAISARGRSVKAKNAEARAAFDREAAQRKAEYEGARSSDAS